MAAERLVRPSRSSAGMDDLIGAARNQALLEPAAPAGEPPHAIDHLVPLAPDPALEAVVAVPVANEAEHLESLIQAFARQRTPEGAPLPRRTFELILLLNQCADGSAAIAGAAAGRHPDLALHVVDLGAEHPGVNVGQARRLLMEAAAARLARVGRGQRGVLLTTDADTVVAPDWLARNLAEIGTGADAVAGQVLLRPNELAALPAALRRRYLLDHARQRLTSQLEGLVDPDPDDPLPRHHQHAGASLAVTAAAYRLAGGMPALPTGEDQAFWHALRRSGVRCRHSVRVRASTSGRLDGRVEHGLAGTLRAWGGAGEQVLVEDPEASVRRLRLRALHAAEVPDLLEVRALARDAGIDPGWLAAHVDRTRPFFWVQEAVEEAMPPAPERVPLARAVVALRALVRSYAAARSSRSSR